MTNWTDGYVTDVGYIHGYYPELNPLRTKLAFAKARLVAPDIRVACELGFGQGLSVNVHAAASEVEWYGTDFNPTQASFAQDLATAAGSSARLFGEAFSEFCNRTDLPDFDFIGLHGIWSWISDESRAILVEFIRRKLKVGGILYVSYNTLPGWANFASVRNLMARHAELVGSPSLDTVSRINGALEFCDRLLATESIHSRVNPHNAEFFGSLKTRNRQYLAHEFFNRDWAPMYFSTMTEWLGPSMLSYACSAHYLDQLDALNLTAAQQECLKTVPGIELRESVRDFLVNQNFRRDYWVKGPRRLSRLEQMETLRTERVLLTTHRPDVSLKVRGALGELDMSEVLYNSVLDVLSEHTPMEMGKLEDVIKDRNFSLEQILDATIALIGSGHVASVQEDALITRGRKRTEKLNAYLLRKARSSNEVGSLASPVIGGAIAVDRFNQLFLLSLHEGKTRPDEWAKTAWEILLAQGQRLVKEGKPLEQEDEGLNELSLQAQIFSEKQLPILKAAQIV